MLQNLKSSLSKVLPSKAYTLLVAVSKPGDFVAVCRFVATPFRGTSLASRLGLIRQVYFITFSVDSPHSQREVLQFMRAILLLPANGDGVVVEAGCFKGSSTAKFSLAAKIAGRRLVVFDSFEGIPANEERHGKTIGGVEASFAKGSYAGSLDEVKANVRRFGHIECVTFVKGWFDQTLPEFNEPIAALYLDVDLASSTRTCLRYLYPLVQSGGDVFSQDGHLPLVLEVFDDASFWTHEVGCSKPQAHGFGTSKLLHLRKQ
jgi:O-methyltransferase